MVASAYSTGYSSQHAMHISTCLNYPTAIFFFKRKNWTVNNPKMVDSLFPIGASIFVSGHGEERSIKRRKDIV